MPVNITFAGNLAVYTLQLGQHEISITQKRFFEHLQFWFRGPSSVVGVSTAYGLDGPEIESRWGEIFRTCPYRSWGPPSLLYNGYRVFPGGKVLPERDADPLSPSSAEV